MGETQVSRTDGGRNFDPREPAGRGPVRCAIVSFGHSPMLFAWGEQGEGEMGGLRGSTIRPLAAKPYSTKVTNNSHHRGAPSNPDSCYV